MKILDLFCGVGGWSQAFAEAGHQCTGIDLHNLGYPYKFIKADLFDWEPEEHYDIILASPPCSEFSIAKKWAWGTQDERIGLDLVYRTFYLIQKIKPQFWALENVRGLAEFLPPPNNILKYNTHKDGKAAYLWTNLGNLGYFPYQINYQSRKEHKKTINGKKHRFRYGKEIKKKERGKIPYSVSWHLLQAIDFLTIAPQSVQYH